MGYYLTMVELSDEQFEKVVSEAIDAIPPLYQKHLQNVAFIVEQVPTHQQRELLGLACNQTLFGLYEGVPLTARNGATKLLPDKITVFKRPLEQASRDLADLKKQVKHTIWHEVAHYYGLDHDRIHALERKPKKIH